MAKPLSIIFAGTPVFAAVHLRALLAGPHQVCAVLTQPDRRAGRGKKTQPSPVKAEAMAAGIPVLQPLTLRDGAIQEHLATLEADVMVVVAYGLLLPQAVLDLPRYGCLNVHASLLPRWRGAAPIQRAIAAGDHETGITIMQMEAGLDTGPMLHRVHVPLDDTITGGELHDRLAELGPAALASILEDLPSAQAHAIPQDDALATYAQKIDKAELALDWRADAGVLARKIRAFAPAPGCHGELAGERLKLWQAVALADAPTAAPGTITAVASDGIDVACGVGTLRIVNAQRPGARAMPAAALINGQRDRFLPGAQFTLVDPA